jgi:hypothetical protein
MHYLNSICVDAILIVTDVPKYFNFATFLEDVLGVGKLGICLAFWW